MIDGGTGCAQRLVMAAVKRFEDLIVWQLAVAVRDAVYGLTGGGGAYVRFWVPAAEYETRPAPPAAEHR